MISPTIKLLLAVTSVTICLSPVSVLCESSLGFGDSVDQPIQHAINKLEAYGTGISYYTGLSMADLKAALAEYKTWSPFAREWAIAKFPTFRLFKVIVLIPLENYELQMPDSLEDADKHWVSRVQDAYKKLRPSYLGQYVGNQRRRSTKMNELVSSLSGIKDEPITKKQVELMRLEYESYRDYVTQLEESDDVFAAINDLTMSLNSLNYPFSKTIVDVVLPKADKIEDPSVIEEVKSDFMSNLSTRGMYLNGGKFVWISEVDKL